MLSGDKRISKPSASLVARLCSVLLWVRTQSYSGVKAFRILQWKRWQDFQGFFHQPSGMEEPDGPSQLSDLGRVGQPLLPSLFLSIKLGEQHLPCRAVRIVSKLTIKKQTASEQAFNTSQILFPKSRALAIQKMLVAYIQIYHQHSFFPFPFPVILQKGD